MVVLRKEVEAAVGKVLDPHINVPLTEMGMLSDICVEAGGAVEVSLALPCMGCPALTMLKENVKRQVRRGGGCHRCCGANRLGSPLGSQHDVGAREDVCRKQRLPDLAEPVCMINPG